MKNKIYSLVMILCLMIFFSMPVNAEKTDWSDNSYDFSSVQRVRVHDVKFTDTEELPNDLITEILKVARKLICNSVEVCSTPVFFSTKSKVIVVV